MCDNASKGVFRCGIRVIWECELHMWIKRAKGKWLIRIRFYDYDCESTETMIFYLVVYEAWPYKNQWSKRTSQGFDR